MANTVLDLLEELIRVESVNPGLDPSGSGEASIAEYVAGWGREHGMGVELVGAQDRPSVILRAGRDHGGRRLLLCGHLDTVGLAGIADGLHPRSEGDRLYARGAYDMKAGLAAALVACRDAAEVTGQVLVAAVADEEATSVGIQDVLARLTKTGELFGIDAAVVAEPTEREIGTAHRGFAWTEVTVTGVAAHGSRPHLGADAILAAGRLLVGFAELDATLRTRPHEFLGPGNLHGSLIRGGTEESTIPDWCQFTVERRTLPGESVEQIEADVADVVRRCRPDDDNITVTTRTTLYRAPMQTPPDAEIVTALRRAAGPGTPLAPLSYWADSAFLSAAGIPTVLYGPEGEGAHADIEWVSRSGTETVADVLTRLAHDFCR